MREPLSVEEVQALGEHIAEQAVHLDAAMHRLLADLRTFDAAGGWYRQGFGTCALAELARRLGSWHRTPTPARGQGLAHLAAHIRGTICRADLIFQDARHHARRHRRHRSRAVGLRAALHRQPARDRVPQGRRLGADAAGRATRPHDSERYVAHTTTASGMVCVKACLRPDEAALLLQVLQQAAVDCMREPAGASAEVADVSAEAPAPAERSADVSAEAQRSSTTTTARRPYNRADGLMALVQSYARGSRTERSPFELIVTVPVALLQQTAATTDSATGTADSTSSISVATDLAPASFTDRGASLPVALTVESDLALSPQATRRLACDCGLVVATVAAATVTAAAPLSVGRKTRTIPAALKRALLLRDRTCRFPGCDHRLFLEGHHLQHWADGGETNLDNLALLCSLHHTYVHERGYRITQSPAGALAFEDPQGRAVVPLPPRPAPPLLGWPAIHAANTANAALPLTATTGQCRWRGERVDSWDAAATITRIQRRADAAAAPAPSAPSTPAASQPPSSSRTPAPPSPPSPLSSVADPPLDPDGHPLRGLWDDLDRHSAIERWVLAEMETTGVDPLSIGRPLPDHLQHPSQRPSLRRS
ncbi:MAG: HNH endonuclease [Myxococcales bacterium]|nr:HNH endonuclease [Myxococcales bacterium]